MSGDLETLEWRGPNKRMLPGGVSRDYPGIGGQVRRARRALGLTQQDLAERLGIHTKSVGRIECGGRQVPPDRLEIIARVLKTRFEIGPGPDDDHA